MNPNASQPDNAARLATAPAADGPASQSVTPPAGGSSFTPQPMMLIANGDRPAATFLDDKTVISKAPPTNETHPPPVISPQRIGQSLVGKRLEHFDLIEFVGVGGMGAVFRAIDTRLGRTVAVKVLSRDATDD